MHNIFLIMLAANKIFIDYLHMTLKKLHVKYNPLHLEIFKAKVEKVQKNALNMHNYATLIPLYIMFYKIILIFK